MKKYSSILLALATLSFAASCAKEVRVDNPREESAEMIDITIVASEKPEPVTAAGTRTFVDGTAIKWSDSGEKIKVWEVATPSAGDPVTSTETSAEGVTTNSGEKISFGISMEDKSGDSYDTFDYYAVYPSSAYQTGSVVTNIALNTAAAQTPSATSFDPSRDLLIGKKVENGDTQASTLNMQFARMVAIGKMTIKNLGSSEEITKITFSAKVGLEDVILAGRTSFNLETGLPVTTYGSNTADHSIILNYEGKGITANSAAGMTAYFTCYPFALNSETPGSFKVIVETATKTFTKEVTVDSSKGLVFKTGQASVFSVNMNGIAGEAKAVDLRYAYLVPADVSLGASYSNISVTKTHGDSWSMFVINASGNIGVRRNDDAKQNDSFIKLPDLVKDIKSVVVTLNSPTSGKTITLEDSATETSGSIASLSTSDATVYTFNLGESSGIKTAYFRCADFQAKVEKIEVYAGTDNRTKLANPASVNAELNTGDPSVTNTIDVTWTAVENASSYIVTLVPDSGDDVITLSNTNSCSVPGLQYEMQYHAAVEAVPADPYLYTNSDAVDAANVVETGVAPSGPKYQLVSTIGDVTEGDYVITWDNTYYLPSDVTAASNPAVGSGITVAGSTLSCNVTQAMIWSFSGDNTEGFAITAGNNRLNSANSSSGISVATSGSTTWTVSIDATYGMLLKGSDAGTRYLSVYNSGSWRYYATGQYYTGVLRLYKFVDPRPAAPISWSADNGTATWSSSGITSSLPNLSNSESLDVSYSSSTESVATINSSGVVTIVGGGTTTISATFTALPASSYKTTTVSYTLTVTDSRSTCDTPTFDPAAGAVAANTTVTISCGTAGATIHYTVDGSTPTAESAIYSSPITIDASKTIKAIAVKENYKNSAVAEASYTVGGDPTTVTKTITQIVSANGYSVSSGSTINDIVTSFNLDGVITVSTTGNPNCGTFWGTSTYDWRLYQNQNGNIIVSASDGHTISKLTITYSASNGGVLKENATTITSGTEQTINAASKTYTVGNSSDKTNGQVRVTQISVTYN